MTRCHLILLGATLVLSSLFTGCAAQPSARDQALALNRQAAALLPDQPAQAQKILEKAQATAPDLAEVLNNLGLCHLLQDQPFEAAIIFRRAATAAPRDPLPLYNLGLTFEKAGNWETAATYYEQALALAPDRLETIENLARIYVKLDRPKEQIAPLAAKALQTETRPEWIEWLIRYTDTMPAPLQ